MISEDPDFKSLPIEEQLAKSQFFRDGSEYDLELIERKAVRKLAKSRLARYEFLLDEAKFAKDIRDFGH